MSATTLPSLRKELRAAQRFEDLQKLLPSLRAALDANADDPRQMAETVYDALHAAAENFQPLDPETEQHIVAWMRKNWTNAPYANVDMMSAILTNLYDESAGKLLEEKAAAETDPRCKSLLRERLADRTETHKKPEPTPAEEEVG